MGQLTTGIGLYRLQTKDARRERAHWRRYCDLAVALVALVALAGCAGLSADASPETKQKAVAERAQARWQALINGDLDAAYQYLSAGSKATTTLDGYKAKIRRGSWRQAKLDKVECEREVCQVTMVITYDMPRMKGIETPVPESWIIENGTAWYIFR